MGDISDMILDGQMCQWCGEILGQGNGYPIVCTACQIEHNCNEFGESKDEAKKTIASGKKISQKKVNCPQCNKRVKKAGLEMHIKDVHGK